MKFQYNFKLILGLLLLLLFILIAIFGPILAPYAEDFSVKTKYIKTEKGGQIIVPPLPPSKDHWFGTDKWGSDLLTLLLYGAKYTVFGSIAVAVCRVIIGSFFGILHALNGRERKQGSKITVLSGIPTFIIIYFVMVGISMESSANSMALIFIQSFLMVILGISGVYQSVFAKTTEIQKNLFVLASESLGASKFHILRAHIFPMLKVNLSIILVNEVILVLNLIGQMAIFNLFFGGTRVQTSPTIYLSITHEWAGLIGQSRMTFYSTQWIVGYPLFFYLLFLFSLYLLSSGLKDSQKDQYRKPIMV